MMRLKAGMIVRSKQWYQRGKQYELVYRFNCKHIPMWAAYQAYKPKRPQYNCNILESDIYKGAEMPTTKKAPDFSKLSAKILIKLVQLKNKTAIKEFIKRYKKMPNI